MIGNGGSDMKRIIVICLCLAMLACGTTAQQEETAHTDTPVSAEPAENETIAMNLAPEPVRYPVREAIAALPEAIEPIDLEDHLLVYESNDATYLYAYGESVFLHQGGIYSWDGPYNYLTEGTAFTFIEPGDGTLHIIDLNDPQKTPATVDSDAVNGVKRFAISQGGNEILFLKDESEPDGETAEALYYFANGEAKRIEESVGEVDQFSLSPDGKSYVFYMMDEPYSEILTINGVPIDLDDHIEDLSEDLRTALTLGSGVLTLYREGTEPLVLSENSELYGCRIMSDGTVRWIETDNTYWEYRGTEKSKLAENAESPHMTESGMIEFFRGGSLYVQFGDDEPLLICAKEPGKSVYLSNILDGGSRIVYGMVSDEKDVANAFMHQTAYVVTVDRSGVSEPTLISDDSYKVIPFRDDFIAAQTEDAITCKLYFKGKYVGVVDDLWNDFHISGSGESQVLLYRSEGKLCRFDGETVTVILDSVPKTLTRWVWMLENGTFLYRDGDARYYYDGTTFHKILENVDWCFFVSFLKEALEERLLHD